ncbi:hypothetical protein CV093_10845 [Oceanobacillus sp. 143]|nr:hypothetical protein CV093_10845 [Oceanobacillus sp. 143]
MAYDYNRCGIRRNFRLLHAQCPLGRFLLTGAAGGVQNVLDYSQAGIDFLFGGFLQKERM